MSQIVVRVRSNVGVERSIKETLNTNIEIE